MSNPIQLSWLDMLEKGPWCNRHYRYGCRCGRKPETSRLQSIRNLIVDVMRQRAGGRVPVSSTWIHIRLMTTHGIERSVRSIQRDLQALSHQGHVTQTGPRGEYQLSL